MIALTVGTPKMQSSTLETTRFINDCMTMMFPKAFANHETRLQTINRRALYELRTFTKLPISSPTGTRAKVAFDCLAPLLSLALAARGSRYSRVTDETNQNQNQNPTYAARYPRLKHDLDGEIGYNPSSIPQHNTYRPPNEHYIAGMHKAYALAHLDAESDPENRACASTAYPPVTSYAQKQTPAMMTSTDRAKIDVNYETPRAPYRCIYYFLRTGLTHAAVLSHYAQIGRAFLREHIEQIEQASQQTQETAQEYTPQDEALAMTDFVVLGMALSDALTMPKSTSDILLAHPSAYIMDYPRESPRAYRIYSPIEHISNTSVTPESQAAKTNDPRTLTDAAAFGTAMARELLQALDEDGLKLPVLINPLIPTLEMADAINKKHNEQDNDALIREIMVNPHTGFDAFAGTAPAMRHLRDVFIDDRNKPLVRIEKQTEGQGQGQPS